MHPFDRSLCLRTLAFVAVVLVGVVAIVVTTDEAFSTLGMRVARVSAFAPAVAAIAAAVAIGRARARGELRALEALGSSPWRAARGATVAAWIVGAVAVAALLSPLADVESLFPVIAGKAAWTLEGGSLVDRAGGVRVAPTGAIELLDAAETTGARFRPTGAHAVLAIGPLAALTPPWITSPMKAGHRIVGGLAVGGLLIVLLHATAAGRVAPAFLMLGTSPLLVQIVASRRALREART